MCKDIKGQKFGRLTAIKCLGSKGHDRRWLCKCDCGKVIETSQYRLIIGKTKSCGCFRKDFAREKSTIHGKYYTRQHNIWSMLLQRCYNKNNKRYKYYGGRGIAVCDAWKNNFQEFYNWAINNGYADNLTIDRIDVNGNYEPNNCRFVDMKQQASNRRFCRYFTINGETRCLSEWCRIYNLSYGTVHSRIYKYGYTIEKALELEEK